jgi:hypothetical protein
MAVEESPQPPHRAPSGQGRRADHRYPQSALESNFGPVLDLSAGGMRIISNRALSGTVTVSLIGKGIDQTLRARVVWSRKISFRVYEIALQFVDRRAMRHLVNWIAAWSSRPPAA